MKPADGSQAFDRGAPFFNDLAMAILRAALATSACAKCRECTVLDFYFLSRPAGPAQRQSFDAILAVWMDCSWANAGFCSDPAIKPLVEALGMPEVEQCLVGGSSD